MCVPVGCMCARGFFTLSCGRQPLCHFLSFCWKNHHHPSPQPRSVLGPLGCSTCLTGHQVRWAAVCAWNRHCHHPQPAPARQCPPPWTPNPVAQPGLQNDPQSNGGRSQTCLTPFPLASGHNGTYVCLSQTLKPRPCSARGGWPWAGRGWNKTCLPRSRAHVCDARPHTSFPGAHPQISHLTSQGRLPLPHPDSGAQRPRKGRAGKRGSLLEVAGTVARRAHA